MKGLFVLVSAMLGILACIPETFAQSSASQPVLYRMSEIGTFGGPNSAYNVFTVIARNDGTVVGAANTDDPDPNAPNCFDFLTCFVQHAWKWQNGELIDLGVLPGGFSSYTNAINSKGLVVGQSENGQIDPVSGVADFVATLWHHGNLKNLGTLGGSFSFAIAATNDNFVMGAAQNGTIDTSGFADFIGLPGGTEMHTFGWAGGSIFDLGTLGGPGAFPGFMNQHGQVVGVSATSSTPGPFGVPPVAPFLWTNGKMRNLGTLGGKAGGSGGINNRGQVIGSSSTSLHPYACLFFGVPGCHPFLWSDGKMKDLGVPSGNYGTAELINDAGQVVGFEVPLEGSLQALMWEKRGITRLGTVAGDNNSRGFGMNAKGAVVGQSWNFDGQTTVASHAFVWRRGGPMLDLNTLLTNPSDLYLFEADFITDSGIIVAIGVKPNGDLHTAILTPDTDTNALAAQPPAVPSAVSLRVLADRVQRRQYKGRRLAPALTRP